MINRSSHNLISLRISKLVITVKVECPSLYLSYGRNVLFVTSAFLLHQNNFSTSWFPLSSERNSKFLGLKSVLTNILLLFWPKLINFSPHIAAFWFFKGKWFQPLIVYRGQFSCSACSVSILVFMNFQNQGRIPTMAVGCCPRIIQQILWVTHFNGNTFYASQFDLYQRPVCMNRSVWFPGRQYSYLSN